LPHFSHVRWCTDRVEHVRRNKRSALRRLRSDPLAEAAGERKVARPIVRKRSRAHIAVKRRVRAIADAGDQRQAPAPVQQVDGEEPAASPHQGAALIRRGPDDSNGAAQCATLIAPYGLRATTGYGLQYVEQHWACEEHDPPFAVQAWAMRGARLVVINNAMAAMVRVRGALTMAAFATAV
jgi:hypothetical protein